MPGGPYVIAHKREKNFPTFSEASTLSVRLEKWEKNFRKFSELDNVCYSASMRGFWLGNKYVHVSRRHQPQDRAVYGLAPAVQILDIVVRLFLFGIAIWCLINIS
jgi:hypothetical protein